MLNNIIGVTLDGTPGPDIAWTADAEGFKSSANRTSLQIKLSELPAREWIDDHSLFTFVSGSDAMPAWINTYQLSAPWRRRTVDALRFAGYQWYANLIVPFIDSDPTLVLFGRGTAAFDASGVTAIYDRATYNQDIRATLRPDLRIAANEADGVMTLEAQLLEPGGADSVRSGVTVYWESTGGYFPNTRTPTIEGKATALLKDYVKPCKVKAGFRYFPSKTEILL